MRRRWIRSGEDAYAEACVVTCAALVFWRRPVGLTEGFIKVYQPVTMDLSVLG